MRSKYAVTYALLLTVGLANIAQALSVKTAPDEVTVYPAGAQVLRQGKADLAAGAQKVLFEGLPASLREESLRLKVEGPKGTMVYAVNLREAYSDVEQAKERATLQDKIQVLEDEKADLGDRIASRKAEADILKALAEKGTARAGSESGAKVAELAVSVGVVGKRLEVLANSSRKDERAQRALDKKLATLKAELAQEGPGETKTRVAEAEMELAEAGPCRFELAYFVDSASWSPRYDLRLRATAKEPKVELDFLAELRQLSGEEWKDVALTLSTARPNLESQVPDPTNWWLDFEQAQLLMAPARKQRSRDSALPAQAPMSVASGIQAKAELVYEEAQYAPAAVQDLGPATLFVIKRRTSIASMDQGQRVAIAKSEHPAELTLVAVPRLSTSAYLEAKILYSGEAPLLPGPAQLFRDGDLSGRVSLPSTAPGETFNLGFGMDEHIKVSRKRRAQKQGSAGFLGSKNKRAYDWDIKVANYHEGLRDIEVREQLPRSRQDGIKVSAVDLEPKPEKEDEAKPGLLVWKLKLKKSEEKSLRLQYVVSWPEEQRVNGLE